MHNHCHFPPADSSETIVCHCLQVTEGAVVEAIAACEVNTVKELAACSGAGEGCTACHAVLKKYLRAAKRSRSTVLTKSGH